MEDVSLKIVNFVLRNENHLILVTATVAVIGLFATLVVSLLNFANLRVATSVSLMKQIQDLNLAIAKGEKALLSPLENGELKEYKGRDGWISELYTIFYQINIVHDAWVAHGSWLLQSNHTLLNTREIIGMQAQRSPEQIRFILNGRRGYPYRFKKFILETLQDLEYLGDLPFGYCSGIIILKPRRFVRLRRLLHLNSPV